MVSTQTESLEVLHASGRAGTVDAAVLATVREYGPICRDALCRSTGTSVSTMCGAIGRLKAAGSIQESPHKVWNNITKRNVHAYIVVPAPQPEEE